ncbi:putative GPI-anchored protein pfl2 isoform X1 [Drosophila guanche]|uniref:putative GPI-anchored protein pfl2 isoform X1 n=1 Tax=Drosophila guanche TaxID=7266 RepID=UPI0014717CE4|nr:putative GPI-anchored protein pfl2 isoform X1 [Drosophila guanche]
MLPQLTVYAKIIYLLMVVISGALCTVEDYVIMSQCAHNKAIHLAAAGTVSVTDISQIQNITIVGLPDYVNNEFKIALYAKETQRYLCFNDNWRLVGMRELRDTCYFNETIVHGYFVFRSVVDLQRRVGFTHRGKPVGPKKSVNDACYMFNKIDAEQFFHQHTLPKWHEMAASQMIASNGNGNGSGNSRKPLTSPSRSNKNNRHKSNNQNQKLQPQQEHHGHNNNSNIIINNSSNSLSSTNKKQLALNRQKQQKQQQQQQQHQVRHHHNDPSLLARRQQHDKKQKRRRKEQLQQRVTASPTKRMTATATATATAATSTSTTSSTATTKWSTATLSIKRKGRRRKGHKPKAKPVTTATSTSSDDSLYSSSSSSSSSLGYEDAYNVSSSSITTLEPWSTWSTIDSFTPDVASVSSSSTTATSDDSISSSSSSSNYDAWSTFITELESEASAGTTTTEMSGNDTELPLHYEAELVEDAETVSTTDYETKGTSAALAATATAATTTSTAGSQLVIEQTPLQEEMARSSTAAAATTGAATPTAATTLASQTDLAPSTHKLSRHRGSGSGSGSMENSRQWLQEGDNKLHKQLLPLQPPTGSTRVPSATTSRRRPGSSAAATATATATSTVESMATTPQQHGLIDKIFSVYKNIKSNLNNTLTEASPTVDTRSTVTAATTTKKSLRKSTQKLMATPYHQLTYVRNEAGDIDIDNLDNISVYPDLFEGELDVSDSGNGNGSTNSNSRLTFVSGYLATSPTSVLPESIRIAKIKINNERRRLQLHSSQRRFA